MRKALPICVVVVALVGVLLWWSLQPPAERHQIADFPAPSTRETAAPVEEDVEEDVTEVERAERGTDVEPTSTETATPAGVKEEVAPLEKLRRQDRNDSIAIRVECEGNGGWLTDTWIEAVDSTQMATGYLQGGFGFIELRDDAPERVACIAVGYWLGTRIESDVQTIRRAGRYVFTLRPPTDGARLIVRVLGPDGLPAADARLSVELRRWVVSARTDKQGLAVVPGVPAHCDVDVRLTAVGRIPCRTIKATANIGAAGDDCEVLFDLYGTGIIECNIRVAGRLPRGSLEIRSIDADSGSGVDRFFHSSRVYGFKPGRYRVTLKDKHGGGHAAEFEVLPPPAVSVWKVDFAPVTLAVRVVGVPAETELTFRINDREFHGLPVNSSDTGREFELPDQGNLPVTLRVFGDGWASEIVTVDPSQTSEIELRVEPSGRLRLEVHKYQWRQELLLITGVAPARPAFKAGSLPWAVILNLPPGIYQIESDSPDALWQPVEATVIAGQTTDCIYGPAQVSQVNVSARNGEDLWGCEFSIWRGGEKIEPCRAYYSVRPPGEPFYEVCFLAEGALTLRVTGPDIQEVTYAFEIKLGETVSIELDLKRRE